jgi:integrase
MKEYVYKSVFKDELTEYANLRKTRGFKDDGIYILQRLDVYMATQNISEKVLSPAIVDGFISDYSDGRSTKTMAHYASYCSQFGRYLETLGISAFIAEHIRPVHGYIPYIFSEDEVNRIFHIADNMEVSDYRYANRPRYANIATRFQIPMLIRLFYGCGLRLGEALALRFEDVNFDTGTLSILKAKGNKDRLVPMDTTLTESLKRYCNVAIPNCGREQLLFEGEIQGKHRHKDTVDRRFKQIVQAAGIEVEYLRGNRKVGVHCLRHTFAVHSFRKQDKAGIDNYRTTPSLSLYLGHDRLLETQRYLHNAMEVSEDIWNITSRMAKSIFPGVPQ